MPASRQADGAGARSRTTSPTSACARWRSPGCSASGFKQTALARAPAGAGAAAAAALRAPGRPLLGAAAWRRWSRAAEGPGVGGASRSSGPADGQPLQPGASSCRPTRRHESFVTPIDREERGRRPSRSRSRCAWTSTRKSDKAGDAFEVKLPVLPDRTVEQFAYFDTLKAGKHPLKPLPEPPRPGTASQEVFVTAIPGVLELVAGLEYLAAYPHGCLEQQLSQLYPEVVQGAVLTRAGLDDAVRPAARRQRAARSRRRCRRYQDEQGLFAFWPGGRGRRAADGARRWSSWTARAGARAQGGREDAARAVEALKRVLRSDLPGPGAGVALQPADRGAAGAHPRWARWTSTTSIDLFQLRERLDATSLADLAAAMSHRSRTCTAPTSTRCASELWDSVIIKLGEGQARLRGHQAAPQLLGRLRLPRLAALQRGGGLRGAAAAGPDRPAARPAARRAARPTRNAATGFGSTYENRRAIAALALYLQKREARGARHHGDALLGRRRSAWTRDTKTARAEVAGDAPLAATVKGGPVGVRVEATVRAGHAGRQGDAAQAGLHRLARADAGCTRTAPSETRFDDKAGRR